MKHVLVRRVRWTALMFVALAALPATAVAQACVGDVTDDGSINGADLGALLASWGPCPDCRADLDRNGVVDGADLGALLGAWGECPGVPSWATVVQYEPDAAVVTDPALRAVIVSSGHPWRVRDNASQIELLLVPPGSFQMGCVMPSAWFSCSTTSLPVHAVTLTRPFYIGRYEVTQAQWTMAMGSNPSYFQSASSQVAAAAVPDRPVERVSWNTVQGFLAATGFRLPTDAEWEFSCRAGTQSPFYNGSTWDPSVADLAWYSDNAANETHPVGGKSANALGLHDMLGNVWELVHDWYGPYSSGAQVDPTGASSGTSRVRRGGSWFLSTVNVNSSYRIGIPPAYASSDMGFRVARDP